MLLFKGKFHDAIRCGKKTQTIRLWAHRHLREGQRSYIPHIGHIRIGAIDEVTLAKLTDEDAVADGFPDRRELVRELRQIYGDEITRGDKRLFRVKFELEAE